MRLNQFLAKSLGISRRQGDELIQKDQVQVNEQIGQLFTQVQADDRVEVWQKNQWQGLNWPSENRTILMYKPIFCVTTRSDPQKRQTIYDHLPKIYHHLKPAGRLDYMSEGLLVLSTDGDMLQKLTHPKFGGSKIYLVGLNTGFEQDQIKQIVQGMDLDNYLLNPVKVWQNVELLKKYDYLKLDPKTNWYFFELTEGRNQQIRKMCAHFGKKVRRLIRLKQGEFELSQQLYEKKYLN
jgi:23S rRNA pseudouridine2605 synthase